MTARPVKAPPTAPAPATEAGPRRRLPLLLRRSWYGLNQTFRRRIAHIGVTPDQYTALRTLVEAPPQGLTQRDLTEAMASDPNTVASLVERMTEAGWIDRRRHETDGRAYRIRPLPPGLERYHTVRAVAIELEREIVRCLPEGERERFLENLDLVSQACRQAAEAANRTAEA